MVAPGTPIADQTLEAFAPVGAPMQVGAVGPRSADPELLIQRGAQEGARFPLIGEATVVGRGADNDIVLEDVVVSRRHVEFRRDHDRVVVTDLESLNGTYLNRQPIDGPTELRHGDEIQVGAVRMLFVVP